MKKRTWTMAALALVALFGVNGGTAKAEWQSIKEVQENTPERWTESYETKWRTIQIDAQIDVPDVEKLPVIRVTGASPVNGLKLLLYSEVVYNEVGQLYVISKDGEPEILGNNEDYKNRYYFADGEIPQIQAEDHPLTAQQAIEMFENKLKGLTGYGEDDFVLGPITVYDRVWKYKKTNGERVYTQPISKTGEYCIELYQKFAGVQYQSCRECYDSRGKEAWPDAAGVSGAIWDADSFKLWATLLQVVDTPYEDVPILSFGDAKKAIETEIEAGHLRNIDKVQLAYDVVFPVGRFPEVISLLMMLFHSGIITIEGEKNGAQKIEPSTAKMKVNPSIARFFNVESPNAKIALEQGWLTANDPRIMNFFSEYEAVVSAYEQAVREGKEHPSEEQEQVIQQRKQKMEKTQMLMQLKPLVLPMDFDYDIETDGDYDPEDYGPVFAEMLEEKHKRQRNPEEKNEKSTM